MRPTIGRIVHYRAPVAAGYDEPAGDYHVAAIVTMTPEEWTPGYRGPHGEWRPTESLSAAQVAAGMVPVAQPQAGTVHLHVFQPDPRGIVDPGTLDPKDVPEGDGPGTWSWPPKVDP